VRRDGEFGPADNAKPENRRVNLVWSTNILKGLAAIKAGDPASRTDYAEALAKINAAEAKTMLEDLARKDLLTTPYAYATLAALRASAGDAKGRDEALAKCATMAATKSICEPNKAKPSG
jgi:predicted Zn-dependent protease